MKRAFSTARKDQLQSERTVFSRHEAGASIVEMALLIALIALMGTASLGIMGTKLSQSFELAAAVFDGQGSMSAISEGGDGLSGNDETGGGSGLD